MKIHSFNEWERLRSVVVGLALHANWPATDPVYALEKQKTTWTDSDPPVGPVPQWIVDETEEDLSALCEVLSLAGVEVHRPREIDWVAVDGMYNYCPRDRLLIAGNTVVDPAMMYPCRDQEIAALDFVTDSAPVASMPRNAGMTLDAANICRLDDSWLYLESSSGNHAAAQWLAEQFPSINIEVCNFYAGVHIDSTVVPLREGLVLLNASRIRPEQCPQVFANWDKIWVKDCVARSFYQYPYASKWIGMNMLCIDPTTVIVDSLQKEIITTLEQKKFTVIPLELRHSRTLGGGFHCVTLDLWRQDD